MRISRRPHPVPLLAEDQTGPCAVRQMSARAQQVAPERDAARITFEEMGWLLSVNDGRYSTRATPAFASTYGRITRVFKDVAQANGPKPCRGVDLRRGRQSLQCCCKYVAKDASRRCGCPLPRL